MADNELAALNANDYEAFIKDYDETMLEATTPENFTNLVTLVSTKTGQIPVAGSNNRDSGR